MINDYEATSKITDEDYATANSSQSSATVSNEDVISTLNNLIETCKDGQEGFKQAAEGVQNSNLKTVFYEYGQHRGQFVGELQALVRELGGDAESSGSMAGALHRGWINIKSAMTGPDDGAILNECERGEDVAKKAYRDAVQQNLPAHVNSVIQKQAQAVQEAHDRVRDLRDRADSTASTNAANS
jgi:uncharacterized protein (TIGR02284 family)